MLLLLLVDLLISVKTFAFSADFELTEFPLRAELLLAPETEVVLLEVSLLLVPTAVLLFLAELFAAAVEVPLRSSFRTTLVPVDLLLP